MNFKRRKPKNKRAGCLMCKPHKMNGVKAPTKIRGIKARVRVEKVFDCRAEFDGVA